LIFNENESEAVRDRLASLQWAVLLFNVFFGLFSSWNTGKKYHFKKCQLTKNSRQCKLWKIVSNLAALFIFLQLMPIGNTVSLSLTASLSYLTWRCSE